MSLPPLQLQPISASHYYTSGDVTIEAGVAIAPGVLIQAEPNSRIIIRRGACIGIGAVIHAYSGVVEVGEGANVGPEVLLVGQITIGARACIGTATTIYNSSIPKGEIIPPGALIGDTSRQPDELVVTDTHIEEPSPTVPDSTVPDEEAQPSSQPESTDETALATPAPGVNVYGKMYVNRLLVKLFPNSPRAEDAEASAQTDLSVSDDPWQG